MKKKLFCVIACLFMSMSLMYPTVEVTTSCGVVVYTVGPSYFTPEDASEDERDAAFNEWMDYIFDLDDDLCK